MSDTTASRLDDYLDVFVSPTKLFERRSDGKFGQALLVLIVLFAVLFFATKTAMAPIFDAEMARGLAAAAKSNPAMTPEQMEAAKKFGGIFVGISIIVGFPIGILILGGIVSLVAKGLGGKLSFAQGATIATFSMYPRLVDSVVGAVQALLMDESKLVGRFSVSLGVGRFLNPDTISPVALAFLGRIDLFTIWVTLLIGLGLKVMARLSTAQATVGAVIIWFVGVLPTLLGALRQ